MRAQPLLSAHDVEAASGFYQRLLGVRVEELGAEIVPPPHRNPPEGDGGPNHREIWLRDRDGYCVVLARPDGEGTAGSNT